MNIPAQSAVPSDDWFRRLPKVELHVHIEGAIPVEVLWDLVVRHGAVSEVRDLEGLRRRLSFRSFHQFIEAWVWKSRFLRDAEDYARIGESFARRCVALNIRHCEAHCSPIDATVHGMTIREVVQALRAGIDRVPQARILLIVDLVRNFGADRAWTTLDLLTGLDQAGVVGVGLGGSEAEHPASLFGEVFTEAAARGWRRSLHAGEAAGPLSIREALDTCHAERIGHGIRAVEDPDLMHRLGDEGIPLEVCPTSNLRTQVVERLDHHPIAALRAAGLRVCLGSDDPAFFGSDLDGELRLLHQRLGWTTATLRDLQLTAADAAFLDEPGRQALRRDLLADPAWNEEP